MSRGPVLARNPMHVAFLCQPFDTARPPTPNSLGLWVYEVARRLPEDWDVSVYMRADGRTPRTETHGRIRYRLIPVRYDAVLARFRTERTAVPTFARASTHMIYAGAAALDMRAHGVDLVHVINFSQFAPILRRIVPRARIVLNMVCEWLSQLERSLVTPRLACVDAVMGCSEHITKLVSGRFAESSLRYFTVGNGIDALDMRPIERHGNDSRRLLFVGRVSPEKGVHTLIEAMRSIVDRFPDATLDVVGGRSQLPRGYLVDISGDPLVRELTRFYHGEDRGAYARALDRMVADNALQDNVAFHDAVPYHAVSNFYARANVVVNPSLSESFGRSLIEAMAFGLPVVATAVGGMPEIVTHEREGLLVEAERPAALAGALLDLLERPERAAEMGRAGRKTVEERFTWDRIAADALAVYDDLHEREARRG